MFNDRPDGEALRPRGFTLIEVVVALTVSLMIIVGLQSCLTLALRTIPKPNSPSQREIAATQALNQLTEDLEYALWIMESTPSRIVMVVPDRNRDGRPDRITYRWTSNGVGKVFKQYNEQPERVLIDDVSTFSVNLQTEDVTIGTPGLIQAGSIVRLDDYDSGSGTVGAIDDAFGAGQWIRPTLPSTGALWRPTQIRLSVWKQNGTSEVEILGGPGLNSRIPATESLTCDAETVSTGLAWSPNQTTFSTPSAPWMHRNQSYCVRILKTNTSAADATFKRVAGSNLATLGSEGWQNQSSASMAYEMDGQWASMGGDQTLSLSHWTTARLQCRADGSEFSLDLTATLLNTPGCWTRRWVIEDSDDPIDADDDADGSADWQIASGTMHETTDSHDLNSNTVVDVDWQCLTASGEGIVLINAFRVGTSCRPVRLRLTRQADRTHYLALDNPTSTAARPLFVLGGLDLDTVRTRLVLNRDQQSVALVANGVPQGSFALSTSTVSMSSPAVQFGSASGGVAYEHFDIKVWQ